MPRESKTTIQKLSSRQVRFLATPDSDPELTKVVANPINTSRDQKNNYAVDGLVKALKDLNPKIAKIAQKNRIVTDKRSTEAGTLAALQGGVRDDGESRAWLQGFDQREAVSVANQHNLDMNAAFSSKPDEQTREQFITEWNEKAQANTEGRSSAFGIKYLELAKAETLKINMGGQAADLEKIAENNIAERNLAMSTAIDDPDVPWDGITQAAWRAASKEAGLNSDQINEMLVERAEIEAIDGETTVYDGIAEGNSDGVTTLIDNPKYGKRLKQAQHKAVKAAEDKDLATQAKVTFHNREKTKLNYNKGLAIVAEGGTSAQGIAQLDRADYEKLNAMPLYFSDKIAITAAAVTEKLDPASYPDYMKRIAGGEQVEEIDVWRDSSLTNQEKAAVVRGINGDSEITKHMKNPVYKEAVRGGVQELKLASNVIADASGAKDTTGAWATTEQENKYVDLLEAAQSGLVNELTKEEDTSKYPEIRKRWADNFTANIKNEKVKFDQTRKSLFIYRTRKSLQHAFTNGYISQSMMEIHQSYFDADDEVIRQEKAKKDEAAAVIAEATRPKTFDEKRAIQDSRTHVPQ